jgi:2-iminoacetate synthase
MKFTPETYSIPDIAMQPFIDTDEINGFINNTVSTPENVRAVIAKSLSKKRLSMQETAILINASDPVLIEEIKAGARELKKRIYGNRIVLFAPLYVGNYCANNCSYCGFRTSNTDALRKTLTKEELIKSVEALEDTGQKRLILVYGEHKNYSPEVIADNVRTVYSVKKGNGEIRRVNINAAPLDIEGFKIVKDAGIGTYQVFQETYHPQAYAKYHLGGKKADYTYRLTAMDRAQEAGIDDVGLGSLFGLYDWRFEVLGLLRHTNHLEAVYNVGPHTLSFPRLKEASGLSINREHYVSDEDFVRIIAILRLAVPYTGLILTAREPADIRRQVLEFGCSQIDAGTKLEIGAYAEKENENQNLNKEQFKINDDRPLSAVISELIDNKYIPSFCTACYRKGRTGEHFMEFSVKGFIKRYCTPNATLTLAEYLCDYASEETQTKGWKLIQEEIEKLKEHTDTTELESRLERVKQGERDLYF